MKKYFFLLLLLISDLSILFSYTISKELLSQADFKKIITTSEITVAYLPPASEYNYYMDIGKGASDFAAKSGINFLLATPQIDDPTHQFKLLDEIIDKNNVNIIIISSHNPSLIAPLLRKAYSKGIGIIIINSDMIEYSAPIHAVIGYSQRSGAKKMADYLINFSQGRDINLGILEGSPGYHSKERVEGFVDALKDFQRIDIIDSNIANWNVEGGFYATLDLLKKNPEINAIFASNDYEIIGALGATDVLKANNLILLGNDGDIAALEAINKGRITATVHTDPYKMGEISIEVALDIVNKSFLGGFVETPTIIVDKKNVNEYIDINNSSDFNIIKKINVIREELPSDDKMNSSGLYTDIIRNVFSRRDIEVTFTDLPYVRGKKILTTGKYHGIMSAYKQSIPEIYYPQWHYNIDTISVMYNTNYNTWIDQSSMINKKVHWIRGYQFNSYFHIPFSLSNSRSRSLALKMLIKKRYNYYIDIKTELEKRLMRDNSELMQLGYIKDDYEIKDLVNLKLYMAFTNSIKGRRLAEIYDDELPKMIYSGELKKLYKKWNRPYPFK